MKKLIVLLAVVAVGCAADKEDPPPDGSLPAEIESADIEDEVGGTDRAVTFTLEVATVSPCEGGAAPRRYGFLIDADRDPETGIASLEPLGVDAQITATCEGDELNSPMGPVTVTTEGDSTRIVITTTGDQLPSVNFWWIAFHSEGNLLARLPAATEPAGTESIGSTPPGASGFKLFEIGIP